jgi:small subunit ribosomal protein S7
MECGKKNTARRIVRLAFAEIQKKKGADPALVFETALNNVGPSMEVRSRRVGGANYQVPREVRPERRLSLAMRWIIQAAKTKRGTPMHKRLADELLAASEGSGEAVKKKENTHKMAEANKAFAHFAW